MEGQSGTGQSQHQYQSLQWSRLVRRNTLQTPGTLPSTTLPSPLQFPPQIEIPPSLLPQQPAAYQAQLAHYNKLISSGKSGRLQSSPLPPVVSAQHIQALPRGNTASLDTGKGKRNARVGHGNNKNVSNIGNGERPLMTAEVIPATMSTKKFDMSNQPNSRPRAEHQNSAISHQSSSVPSTPHQHARKFSIGSREPSPDAAPGHSPRSAYSESNSALPSLRPYVPRYGCKYETAMAHSRRRMAYSIGSEKLEKAKPSNIKQRLTKDDERKLTGDMRELYDRLLPTPESEAKRKRFVQKLEKLLNDEWPGHDIRVHMFGSSGNLLCTDESDGAIINLKAVRSLTVIVDICITTEWKELEGVCMLAELLARHGMEKVICVSTAKVPIVKIWDPELCLACDMNVNNTLALENTRMIKTYVQIDDRVRPLAMIIKHWTKRRIVNDAAFGGTLSSYTWICMIINFLQTRRPPLLPALHQRPHLKLPSQGGHESSFADDIDVLRGYGNENKETLGELLFQFFRYYGHELDYDKSAISVRSGKLVSKIEKGWHQTTNNRLCVEEPFNVSRNLGNTADDTSFRGLHMELRRAFDLIAEANLDECCDLYIFPKEEQRIWEKPVPQPRPILVRSSSQSRGGRGGTNYRGGRHNNHNRNGNNSRRASSASAGPFDNSSSYLPHVLPPGLTPQEAWLRTQAAQEQLHNDLYTTFSVLQAQENNLRLQLYTQSQVYVQAQAQTYQVQRASNGAGTAQQATDRHRGNSFDNPPLTAPLRQDMYFYPIQYPTAPTFAQQGPSTYPSSPSMSPALPELRRSLHRSTVTGGQGAGSTSSGSLRSHSQPATRSVPSPLAFQGSFTPNMGSTGFINNRQASGVVIPNFIADENLETGGEIEPSPPFSESPPGDAPKEYVGYYVSDPPKSQLKREAVALPPIPAFGDIQRRRRLSSEHFPQVVLDRIRRTSRSPSPHRGQTINGNLSSFKAPLSNLREFSDCAPPVVNGSSIASIPTSSRQHIANDATPSESSAYKIPAPAVDGFSGGLPNEPNYIAQAEPHGQTIEARHYTVPIVNGSASRIYESDQWTPALPTTNGISTHTSPTGLISSEQTRDERLSLNKDNRAARQTSNGAISPLEIGLGLSEVVRDDLGHLSPVYEMRTPSPTANRKLESILDKPRYELKHASQLRGQESTPALKLPLNNNTKGSQKQNLSPKSNGHTRASKSEGGGPGAWQKIPKSKKKGHGSDQKIGFGGEQTQSEQIPRSDTERKGG